MVYVCDVCGEEITGPQDAHVELQSGTRNTTCTACTEHWTEYPTALGARGKTLDRDGGP